MNAETKENAETTEESQGQENPEVENETGGLQTGSGSHSEDEPSNGSGGSEDQGGEGSQEISEEKQDAGNEVEDITEDGEVIAKLPEGLELCKSKEGAALRVSPKFNHGWVSMSKEQWVAFFDIVESHLEEEQVAETN